MKKLYIILLAVALGATSCVKELSEPTVDPETSSAIPSTFDWKTTQDVVISVAAPTVSGVSETANVRVYSSPLLNEENIVAKGVAVAGGRFSTALTVPAGTADLYVKTTLPDGSLSVQSTRVAATMNVPGAVIKPVQAARFSAKASAATRVKSGFDELEIPALKQMAPAEFDPQAVISTIEAGKSYKLGGNSPYYAAENYLIPQGAVITSGIDLSGDLKTTRTLYVAGKLQLNSLQIGPVTLAVLPGGEVNISNLTTYWVNKNPGIYVFEGGKFAAGDANLVSKIVVNKGVFEVDNMDANNNTEIYNFAGATMTLDEAEITNHCVFHNDGALVMTDSEANSNVKLYNWENGSFDIAEFYSANGSVEIWQRGIAHFGDFRMSGGAFYFQCYTTIDKFYGDNGYVELASGTGLDVEKIDFNSGVKMSLASASILTVGNFTTGGADFTSEAKKNSDQTPAVILITDKAECATWGTAFKGGPLEVVYDGRLDKKLFSNGSDSYQTKTQETVLAPTVCNGGKSPVEPDPDPVPEEEYSFVAGAPFTYTFEDNWPWFGDYDMNDVVVLVNIDREISKDGTKVASLRINWELKAAGSAYKNAFAVQLDKVLSSQIAAPVESTYKSFGNGVFAAQGLEDGNEQAVIALFNDTKNVLSGYNTWKHLPHQATTKYTTTVKFSSPIAPEAVVESALNFFIVSRQRENEVHMPGYKPTVFADIKSKGDYHVSDPYKYFVTSGNNVRYNNMMWALVVPGDFRYPAENKNIRDVYKNFMAWAISGGAAHPEWYSEESDEANVY